MNGIFEKISQYHTKCVIEEEQKHNDKINEIENLKKQILAKGEKIKYLIKLGKHCNENGIFTKHINYFDMMNRKNGYFCASSWSHNLGYCCEYNRLGIFGGGVCNYDMSTDGDVIYVSGSDTLYVLKRFVNELEEFEHDLLNYIEGKIKD